MFRNQRIEPGPGQESVWDYPRPPRIESSTRHIRVIFNGITLADTRRALRVLETSHPPVFYIPSEDVCTEFLITAPQATFCEYKGTAGYYTVRVADRGAENAAWFYARPTAPYQALAGHVAFYPGRMDACYVDDEQVEAQEGDFYGGWITREIVGPFKGALGTRGW